MALITSISGIRGTIGGKSGEALTPLDIVRFSTAYAEFIRLRFPGMKPTVIVGRDARISGPMVESLVTATLSACGINVIQLGHATTPTVEMAVIAEKTQGGIIITASHNPIQWNALKLLGHNGEFLSAEEGEEIIRLAQTNDFSYAPVDQLGVIIRREGYLEYHIQKILELPYVDTDAIRRAKFRVAVDAVNSVGGTAIPALLKALGVQEVIPLNCTPDGLFAHNPEPLPEHLTEISVVVPRKKAHLGLVVDPDVDRLAIVCEDGSMFGEEYTLVAVADYVLSMKKGNTVSNLSSSRALRDITEKHGGRHFASAVGEVNVVAMMKKVNAVIGGEGNGGVILPDLHYGRDALAGTALFLSHLAKSGKKTSELRAGYPHYVMSKKKVEISAGTNVDHLLAQLREYFKDQKINDADGIRIDFPEGWVHVRKSNTEPIVRIYSEGTSTEEAERLVSMVEKVLQTAGS
ncbi:MAG: phosphoglucosamine mutase [Bacteroidales bacterium]|nr:phosphoglucosamine mutase [Bacteroidales bacterium]